MQNISILDNKSKCFDGFTTPDKFPATKGHIQVIFKRYVKNYFGFNQAKFNAKNSLINEEKKLS